MFETEIFGPFGLDIELGGHGPPNAPLTHQPLAPVPTPLWSQYFSNTQSMGKYASFITIP